MERRRRENMTNCIPNILLPSFLLYLNIQSILSHRARGLKKRVFPFKKICFFYWIYTLISTAKNVIKRNAIAPTVLCTLPTFFLGAKSMKFKWVDSLLDPIKEVQTFFFVLWKFIDQPADESLPFVVEKIPAVPFCSCICVSFITPLRPDFIRVDLVFFSGFGLLPVFNESKRFRTSKTCIHRNYSNFLWKTMSAYTLKTCNLRPVSSVLSFF